MLAGWLAGLAACRTVAEAVPAETSPAPRAAAPAPSVGAAPDTVTLAVLAHVPVKWDKEANLAALDRMARGAAAAGAELLVTPEGALEGYLIDELLKSPEREKWEPRFQEIAEPVDGPGVGRVRALARELGVDIVLGFLERDGALLHNSCAWIDRNGEV
ncbi:MAG TPA: carbon-nitrogen hydrolase family protein, partial [Candidatus Hydrogenedentes bacterium]|nr:carbon-nitrogen hydrolase family protein [Candidatus Hydrogenedentota bacterium]